MDYMRICDATVILLALICIYRLEKKNPDECKQAMTRAFGLALIISSPFCIIQLLSVLGVELMDVPWAITPLDIMAMLSISFFMILAGKVAKIYGFEKKKSNENISK